MTKNLNSIINALVHATNPGKVKRLYREWADSYESDLAGFGYVAPQLATQLLMNLVENQRALIYDAGCGTGLVGQLLTAAGYTNLHGADFSDDMLELARQTGVYSELSNADYSTNLELSDETYEAIISVGVYTARFNGFFLPEMLRILKPGGHLVFTCRAHYFTDDVEPALRGFTANGDILNLQSDLKPYMDGQNANAWYISLQKRR